MAKKSMLNREQQRQKLAARFEAKRVLLRAVLSDQGAEFDAKMKASAELSKLPRDSSVCRQVRRCSITGRPKGVYRKFALGRNKLRQLAMSGEIPGLRKASW
jgi:small subunit ribosomal protein S14